MMNHNYYGESWSAAERENEERRKMEIKMKIQFSLFIELCVRSCSDHISITTEQHGAELQIKSLLHVKPD